MTVLQEKHSVLNISRVFLEIQNVQISSDPVTFKLRPIGPLSNSQIFGTSCSDFGLRSCLCNNTIKGKLLSASSCRTAWISLNAPDKASSPSVLSTTNTYNEAAGSSGSYIKDATHNGLYSS